MMQDRFKRVLVIGAGEAGRIVAAEIGSHAELNTVVTGFLDDDPALAGDMVDSIPVLGKTSELEAVMRDHEVDEIIIAIPTAPGRFIREMIKRCRCAGVPFKIVPGVMEIIRGTVHIDQIREVRVEDLLGRETVAFDLESAKEALSGKRILVTGAGGSIGSELCRQLAQIDPGELVLFGRGENRIFDIEEELKSSNPGLQLKTVIADLRDRARVERIMGELMPEIIYHAAAHKHVHYMENDPEEAVLNNVAGSVNIILAAEKTGAERFVFISTDKAANPIGIMGGTKRVIELYLRMRQDGSKCRFLTVRFGNVIGSTGSVVPLFLKQVSRGGPVTVSDRRATRFFMTIREASLLVIRASVIGTGGETFILDMGEALSILEIAQDIIMLTGHEPESEIPIEVTGLREGEKLHEELAGSDEELVPVGEKGILLATPALPVPDDIEKSIEEMIVAAGRGDAGQIKKIMKRLMPGIGL
jgi:FlaA1/EpsC-like NDP-sugar epimerase